MNQVMQIEIIPDKSRGVTKNERLSGHHSFSFGKYYNPNRLNFGTLCVLNEDIISPGKGFSKHPHENMEIITIVLEGTLEHKDSQGHQELIRAGDVQRMSAGTGIMHSEQNGSEKEPVHLLQIWIYPEKQGLTPSYEKKNFAEDRFKNTLCPIALPNPTETTLTIHQDAHLFRGDFDGGQTIKHTLSSKKYGTYLFLIEGQVTVGGKTLGARDAAQISDADAIEIEVAVPSKILLIEVSLFTL